MPTVKGSRVFLVGLVVTASSAWAVGAQSGPAEYPGSAETRAVSAEVSVQGEGRVEEDPWAQDIQSMPICPEDTAVEVEPHIVDANGPESSCRRPDITVDGPAKRAIPLEWMEQGATK